MREGEAVKDLLNRVTTFQQEAVEILNQDTPDSDILAKMVDTGCSLDIDLPELPRLKHKLQQVVLCSCMIFQTVEGDSCLRIHDLLLEIATLKYTFLDHKHLSHRLSG